MSRPAVFLQCYSLLLLYFGQRDNDGVNATASANYYYYYENHTERAQ